MRQETVKRWLLFTGLLMLLQGCVLSFPPREVWAHYRSLITFHIESMVNGILLLAFAFVSTEMDLSPMLWTAFFVSAQLGTWMNGTPFIIAAYTGSYIELSPHASSGAPVTTWSPILKNMLLVCAIFIILSFILALFGVWKKKTTNGASSKKDTNTKSTKNVKKSK